MRRSLVLTQEHRRHPFRVRLPMPGTMTTRSQAAQDTGVVASAGLSDARGVVSVWFAAFAAVLVFIL
ncbi:hypothetical protein EYB45_05835 [Erythrobacteraceae bacterium CFH 75059]|uniref:hypothetical protein n=1 Tax=Qipengyuania thermophila TaxID=2509361 RepID=UPI0010207743|nr:hypothetical protein [Qipengyuania thermophila]TCD05037.1 hypothetical protein EYB45_05835 [Erythrobacteraceae bacterium CFH 75059]